MHDGPQLAKHERAVVFLLLFGLSIAATLAFFDDEPALPSSTETEVYLTPQTVTVSIDGAVKNPGSYTLPKNSTIQDLFDQAQPTPQANTRRFKSTTRLRTGRHLHLKERSSPRKTASQ